MFTDAARKKAHTPAARRKAAATRKRNMKMKGKTEVMRIEDMPGERPPKKPKGYTATARKHADNTKLKLAQDLLTLIGKILS